MRRKESESVQEFSYRFKEVYNAIPAQFKPPPSSAQLQYVEAFDCEFTLLLCKRKSASLADMMNEAVEVEVNLMSAQRNKRNEGEWWWEEENKKKEKEPEQPSTSYNQEAQMGVIMETLERLVENLSVDHRPPPRGQREQQNKNQNVGWPQILQNKGRDQRILPE